MKKRLFFLLVACVLLLVACKKEGKQEIVIEEDYEEEIETLEPLTSEDYDRLWPDAKKLVWIVEKGVTVDVDPEIFIRFNDLLLEKGADFVVEFIGIDNIIDAENYQSKIRDMKAKGEQVDLLNTGGSSTYNTYFEAINDDLLVSIDSYLETEDGQRLFNKFDHKTWERVKVDNHIYGFFNTPIMSMPNYVYLNNAFVNKYNISLPNEIRNLYEMEEVLEFFVNAHKEDDEFIPFYIRLVDYKELTEYAYFENGIAVGYNEKGVPYAYNPFEQTDILELMSIIAHYSNNGYLVSEVDTASRVMQGDFFAVVGSYSPTHYHDGKYDTGEKIVEVSAFKINDDYVSVPYLVDGIASWSRHKDEAFKLLTMLNTDSDLSNLLRFGIEGKHYELDNGEVKHLDHKHRIPGYYSPANELITHPIGLEPPNKEQVYKELNASAQMSPIAGFTLDESSIATELETIKGIYDKYENLWTGKEQDVDASLAMANKELQDAGIGKVLVEINHQLEVWWESKQ